MKRTARAEKSISAHPLIIINSDRATHAAGEAWCGVARGKQNLVFLKLDTGISAGIIIDGQVLQGAGSAAGMAGWFALSEEFRDEYSSRGCLETEGAGAALVRRTIEEWSGGADSLLGRVAASNAAELTPATIIRAARAGDALALKVITEACGWIGRGVADLISTLNPEVVVIGGELGLALRPFLNHIRREARLWAHPMAARQCRILSSTLRQTAGLLGAAQLAWMGISSAER
jgi:glucokinase